MYSILQNDQNKMDELLQLTKDYGLNFLQNINSRPTSAKENNIELKNKLLADGMGTEEALKEFAKIKCQELLEIVAEKARIINEDGDVYQQPHIFFCNGEAHKNWVDKDSILNCVDLENFCY